MKTLAILGASGHGKVVADVASTLGWQNIVFFDDGWPKKVKNGDWEVIGCSNTLQSTINDYQGVVVAIGDNQIRFKKQLNLEKSGAQLIQLIHPSSIVSRRSKIGPGSVIMAGVVINAFSSIGRACIINTSATVDHDCLIGDGCHVSPGANLAGSVELGQGSWIGIGAAIRQNIKIGTNAIVGAGAVVVCDVLDATIVTGCPATPLARENLNA